MQCDWSLPSANASPELMELGKAKPLCMDDHHKGGIRHIDANFDYGCANEDVNTLLLEVPHDRIAFGPLSACRE